MELFLAFAIGYGLGSIPFGFLLTRLAGLGDIREVGSGNIGATNVLRTGHKGLAALTLALDMLKGAAAVWIAHEIGALYWGMAILAGLAAGLGAFVGHIFPVWLRFKGGKGVATYIGVLAGLYWPAALVFCGLWLAVAWWTRYSSLSALAASAATPVIIWGAHRLPDTIAAAMPYLPQPPGGAAEAVLSLVLTALLLLKHRANIRRLLSGEEPKIGAKTS